MNKFTGILIMILTSTLLTSCTHNNVQDTGGSSDGNQQIQSNHDVLVSDTDIYKQKIDSLKDNEYYAFVDIGLKQKVLLVSNSVYRDENNAGKTVRCDVWCSVDNKPLKIGTIQGDSRYYPVACDGNSLYTASDSYVRKYNVDESSKSLSVTELKRYRNADGAVCHSTSVYGTDGNIISTDTATKQEYMVMTDRYNAASAVSFTETFNTTEKTVQEKQEKEITANELECDLDGNGIPDKIRITQKEYESGFTIEYAKNNGECLKHQYLSTYGCRYDNAYAIENFVIVTLKGTGTGQLYYFYAITYDEGASGMWAELYSGEAYNLALSDNYKAELNVAGINNTLDLSANKDNYKGYGIYDENGRIIKSSDNRKVQDVKEPGYSYLQVEDNSIHTVITVQGIAHWDTVAEIKADYVIEAGTIKKNTSIYAGVSER